MDLTTAQPIAPTDLPQSDANNRAGSLDPQEQQEIIRIMTEYFTQEFGGDADKAHRAVAKIAKLITHQAAKLVHLGNTVFLVLVKGKGRVEVHTMAAGEDSASLAGNFVKLAQYLKNIGVEEAYTFSDDPKFAIIAKRTRLPFKTRQEKVKGKETTVYTVDTKDI